MEPSWGPPPPRWPPGRPEGPSEPLPRSGLLHGPGSVARRGTAARRSFPDGVRGRASTTLSSRGALKRARRSRECSRSSSRVGGSARIHGHDPGDDPLTPFIIGAPVTATSATPGWEPSAASTSSGHTVSRPERIGVVGPSVHDQPALGVEAPAIPRPQPAVHGERVGRRRRITPVALHHGRTGELDLTRRTRLVTSVPSNGMPS